MNSIIGSSAGRSIASSLPAVVFEAPGTDMRVRAPGAMFLAAGQGITSSPGWFLGCRFGFGDRLCLRFCRSLWFGRGLRRGLGLAGAFRPGLGFGRGFAAAFAGFAGVFFTAAFFTTFFTFAIRVSSLSNMRFRITGPRPDRASCVRNRVTHQDGRPSIYIL